MIGAACLISKAKIWPTTRVNATVPKGDGQLDKDGPEPTSAISYDAAVQLRQTGHWCIAQHFEKTSDGCVDEAAVHVFCLKVLPNNPGWSLSRFPNSQRLDIGHPDRTLTISNSVGMFAPDKFKSK